MVIYFAVIDDHIPTICRDHGLASGGRKRDDCQPRMAKSRAGVGVDPGTLAVRAAMSQRFGHHPDGGLDLRPRSASTEVNEADETAHRRESSERCLLRTQGSQDLI